MKFEEFEDHLDRFGDDLMVWPPSAREAGIELLRDSAEAREIMQEAQALRRAMAAGAPVRAPAGLADRVVAEALRARPVAQGLTQGLLPHEPLPGEPLVHEPVAHEPVAHEPVAHEPIVREPIP